GVGTFGVVAGGVSEALEAGAVQIGFEDGHVRVEVPLITAPFLGFHFLSALLDLGGVMFLGVRIEMAAGEDDLFAVGSEEAAGGLADAGADSARLAGGELHD